MTRGIVALGFLAILWASPAAAQKDDGDEGELDIGMPVDEEPQPDDGEAVPEGEGVGEGEEPEMAVRDPVAAKKLAEGATKIVKKGDKLKKRKKLDEANAEYERALIAFERSFELDPVAAVLVQAAVLHAHFERWSEAADRFRRALAETEIPLDDKTRARAQAGLDASMSHLGVVTLSIVPDGALVTLNGAELGATPLAEPLVLPPGDHVLRITADDYVDFETKLVVEGGSESERRFELEPVPVVVEPVRPPPPPPPPPLPPEPSKVPLFAGVGATAAFTIGAVVTGLMAVGKHGTFTDPEASPSEREDAQSSGRFLSQTSDLCTGLAVVGAGFTVYYYLKIYQPKATLRDEAERERAGWHDEMSLVPTFGPESAGLVLSGRF